MNFRERIELYVTQKGISKSQFERLSGLSNGYINNVKGNPSEDKLRGILSAFPDIEPMWLLTGEGNMLKGGAIANVGDFNIALGENSSVKSRVTENSSELELENANLRSEVKYLKEKVEHLQEIIAEKERLIGVLLSPKS